MKKIRTFFDCDGFIFDTIPAHIDYIEKKYGVRFTANDFAAQPDISQLLRERLQRDRGLSYNEVYKDLGVNFIASWEWHQHVKPIEGAVEVIQKLSPYTEIFIITRRPNISSKVLEKLIKKHIPDTISGIRFGFTFGKHGKHEYVSKKEHISALSTTRMDLFFDDSLHECTEMNNVVKTYLFDPQDIYRNNPHVKGKDMPVVKSWIHVEEKVMKNVNLYKKSLTL